MSAPVHYEDTMLILATDRGTAAVPFTHPIQDGGRGGVGYRFRFLPAGGGREEAGEGEVFELERAGANKNRELDRVTVRAGGVELKWSVGGAKSGWLYYQPEEVTVVPATARRFDPARDRTVDLLPEVELKRLARPGGGAADTKPGKR